MIYRIDKLVIIKCLQGKSSSNKCMVFSNTHVLYKKYVSTHLNQEMHNTYYYIFSVRFCACPKDHAYQSLVEIGPAVSENAENMNDKRTTRTNNDGRSKIVLIKLTWALGPCELKGLLTTSCSPTWLWIFESIRKDATFHMTNEAFNIPF